MKRMRHAFRFLPLWALVLCGVAGCSGGRATVSGKVTFNGNAVPAGQVVFQPEDKTKQPERAAIQSDGTYSCSTVQHGKNFIAVEPGPKSPTSFMPKDATKKFPKDQPIPDIYKNTGKDTYVDIPQEFRDPFNSGYTLMVDGNKSFDIPLKK
jgi:hypothetical protein